VAALAVKVAVRAAVKILLKVALYDYPILPALAILSTNVASSSPMWQIQSKETFS
jgi:hypothetical protein